MNDPGSLTVKRVGELVVANRAIRAPNYVADHDERVRFTDPKKGLQWGADVIPALMDVFRVEKDPRDDHPNGWMAFARHWRGDTLRLDFDLKPGPNDSDSTMVVTTISARQGEEAILDKDLGEIELPDQDPTEEQWKDRIKRYQAVRRDYDFDDAAAVAAYIDALPGWKRDVASQFDAIVQREVPHVRRAVKWHIPFYGLEGEGWFASIAEFSKHVKLTFVGERYLEPVPPSGKGPERQAIDLRENDAFDEEQIASWVRQAAANPGLGS